MVKILYGDNLEYLKGFEDETFNLIYIDPPFNTGKIQKKKTIKNKKDELGDRTGFAGKRYSSETVSEIAYSDIFSDYIDFVTVRLEEAYRILKKDGTLCFHIDFRESHYCKIVLDKIFGKECFLNEIIWSYDYGARSKKKWSAKHDTIFIYVKNPKKYTFNYSEIDRIPYKAPGLVGAVKAKIGKTPTDVWENTIVHTNGKEKTGYPNQKPLSILNRIVKVHSNPGDKLLDFFAGSGSFGEAALSNNREVVLIDQNVEAIAIINKRLEKYII